MRKGALNPQVTTALPWLVAVLLWFGLITPMRSDQETLLGEQSRIRRERVANDRAARDAKALNARVGAALGPACRGSSDPAALRQRAVLATAGLNLSPFGLSVTGGAAGGALVEAEGPRADVQELLRRLGDPARGDFLRTVTVRQKGPRWGASAATGLVGAIPAGLLGAIPACGAATDPAPRPAGSESESRPEVKPRPTRATPSPSARTSPALPIFVPAPEPPAPFTLVGFLRAEGRNRVSLRVGTAVRIVSVGDQIEGWTCVSIDRDEGAVFTSPSAAPLVLKPQGGPGH